MNVRQRRAAAAALFAIAFVLIALAFPLGILSWQTFDDRRALNLIPAKASIWEEREGDVVLTAFGCFGTGVLCLLGSSAMKRKAVEPHPFIPDPLRHLGAR